MPALQLQGCAFLQRHRHSSGNGQRGDTPITADIFRQGGQSHTAGNCVNTHIGILCRSSNTGEIRRTRPAVDADDLRISQHHILRHHISRLPQTQFGQRDVAQRDIRLRRQLPPRQCHIGAINNDTVSGNGRQLRSESDGGAAQLLRKADGDLITGQIAVRQRNGGAQRAFPGIIRIGHEDGILLFRSHEVIYDDIRRILTESSQYRIDIIGTPGVTGKVDCSALSQIRQHNPGIVEIIAADACHRIK